MNNPEGESAPKKNRTEIRLEEILFAVAKADVAWRFVDEKRSVVEGSAELKTLCEAIDAVVQQHWTFPSADTALSPEDLTQFIRDVQNALYRQVIKSLRRPKYEEFPVFEAPPSRFVPLLTHPAFHGQFACYSENKDVDFAVITARMTTKQASNRVQLYMRDASYHNSTTPSPMFVLSKGNLADRLAILSGESGSGKTHAGMSINGRDGVTVIFVFAKDCTSKDRIGDAAFEDEMVGITLRTLTGHDLAPLTKKHDLVLFVDECGSMPNRLNRLCRVRAAICTKVQAALEEQHVFCRQVLLLAAGSGTDGASAADTMPRSYAYYQPAAGRELWKAFVAHQEVAAEKQDPVVGRLCRETLERWGSHPYLEPLLQNTRAASLLCAECEFHLGDLTAMSTPNVTPTNLMLTVSARFRYKNVLRDLSFDELGYVSAQATRLALCTELSSKISDDDVKNLCRGYGLLSDKARWCEAVPTGWTEIGPTMMIDTSNLRTASTEMRTDAKSDRTKIFLCAPSDEPRYEMSAASAMMILSRFGLDSPPASTVSGTGFETAFQLKMRLCLQTAVSAGEVYQMLGLPERIWRPAGNVFLNHTLVLDDTLSHRVSRPNKSKGVHVSTQCSETCIKTIDGLGQAVESGCAVNVINASGAPFADNIAMTAGLLILGQTKDYATEPLSSKLLEAETQKVFGASSKDVLARLRAVSNAKPVFVVVARKVADEARPSRANVFVLQTSGPNSVFRPMLCPYREPMTAVIVGRLSAVEMPADASS